jgi:hypothetical protein
MPQCGSVEPHNVVRSIHKRTRKLHAFNQFLKMRELFISQINSAADLLRRWASNVSSPPQPSLLLLLLHKDRTPGVPDSATCRFDGPTALDNGTGLLRPSDAFNDLWTIRWTTNGNTAPAGSLRASPTDRQTNKRTDAPTLKRCLRDGFVRPKDRSLLCN